MKYTFSMLAFVAACAAPGVGEVTDTTTGAQSTETEDDGASDTSSTDADRTKDGGAKEGCEDGGAGGPAKRGH